MNLLKYGFLSACLMLLLAACGFHLRGWNPNTLQPLPFDSIYLAGATSIKSLVRENLSYDARIKLLANAEQANAQLTLSDEHARKDVLTINSSGKINQYLLIYRVSARLRVNGKDYGPIMQIRVRRTLNYTDSEVLGKDQEELLLWNDMHKDAAEQIVHRLSYQKPISDDKATASSPLNQAAKPSNERTKP